MAAEPVLDVLFAGQSRTELQSLGRIVRFDAVLTRSHGRSTKITDAPIEDGSNINDHAIREARTLTIEGLVSDHPVDAAARAVARTGMQPRSEAAAGVLESLWDGVTLLTAVTRLHVYKDVLIESLTWNESADVGEALAFTMQLKQVRIVSLATVLIENLASATADLSASRVRRGRRQPKRMTAATIEALEKAYGGAARNFVSFVQTVVPTSQEEEADTILEGVPYDPTLLASQTGSRRVVVPR